ncbi:MAG: DUF4823 domain-containing protein [Candidatus Marinimicrobia bacterium]|nr:DUF4823 domain-containing protein [Candidatus Neomarinimicrobiota bacterium]
MKFFNFASVLLVVLLASGCAAVNANKISPMKSSMQGQRIIVFPFQDPYYKGRQIQGVGGPFSAIFTTELQAANIQAESYKGPDFQSFSAIDLKAACKYANENGYDIFAVGVVTEWIDGATQWSGRVDVAALTVEVYNAKTCELAGSASGRETGNFITFVNAPTTRFYQTLSKEVVQALIK